MKKKLFLSIIPLCLTLGACSSPVNDSDKTPIFENAKEDTEGHDDLFINADIKYLDPTPAFSEEPRLGIQSIAGDGDTSIRFVGAVNLTDATGDGVVDESDLTGDQIVKWNIAAYNANGSVHITRGNVRATKIYKSIGASGESYSINAYNEANNTNFTHFVTYVIRNIPDSDSKAILQLYLFVGNVTNVVSKCIITTVDLTTKYYTNYNQGNGYYAIKKSANGCEVINATSVSSSNIMFNYTQSVDLTLNENDSVIFVNNNSSTYLLTKGFSSAYNDPTLSEKDGDSDFIKVKESGNYVLRYGSDGICLNKAGADNFGNKPMIYADGTKVLYGLYPTYNIKDETTLTNLNTAYPNAVTPVLNESSNPETGNPDGQYFYLYNGEYYAKLKDARPYSSSTRFDNSVTIVEDAEYWFKCEPILWDIVEDTNESYQLADNQKLLFSRYVLDTHVFGASSEYRDSIGLQLNGHEYYNFREKAFVLGESSLATIDTYNLNGTYYPIKVFLFSESDVDAFSGKKATNRKHQGTDWLKANHGQVASGCGYFWTSTSATTSNARIVAGNGAFQSVSKALTQYGICPGIVINL